MRINPIHVRERTAAGVVVDADQESIFEPLQTRAVNAVTLENDRRFVNSGNALRLHHLIGEG